MKKPKVIFLVGPTAMGKSDIAVHLAKKIKGEIISCDSMQVYRRMNILTSKPSVSLRRKVAHHLIDILSAQKEYNVARYRQEAIGKVKEVVRRGRIPLFVGGTGLYLSCLIDGIFQAKAENKKIRQRLYRQAESKGSHYLYERLKKKDPRAASKIHPNDTRRIVRALEVFNVTGKPISQLQKERKGLADEYAIRIFGLNMDRPCLYKRIDARVDKMFRKGLLSEVKKLLKQKISKTASCAIGIKELKGYFDGEYNLEEAKRLMKRNSRLYAKRQLTWFRKDKRIEWIEVGEQERPKEVAKRILGMVLGSVVKAKSVP